MTTRTMSLIAFVATCKYWLDWREGRLERSSLSTSDSLHLKALTRLTYAKIAGNFKNTTVKVKPVLMVRMIGLFGVIELHCFNWKLFARLFVRGW